LLTEFSYILDNLPVEKSNYILECIKKCVNDEIAGKQPYTNNKMRLKMGELASKYFSYSHD